MTFFKLEPGPKVGEILETVFKEVNEGKLENKKEILLEYLKKIHL